MISEWFRLGLGLLIIAFHKPIADFILVQERQLAELLNRCGWHVPTFPTPESARSLYFCFGACICAFALTRIWLLL